jgi:hypothetical protein
MVMDQLVPFHKPKKNEELEDGLTYFSNQTPYLRITSFVWQEPKTFLTFKDCTLYKSKNNIVLHKQFGPCEWECAFD